MMKLLLIDDDAFLRDMYAIKFSQSGHEVDVAESGAVALAKLQDVQDFDVILLDLIMPGMSGIEFMNTLNEDFPKLQSKRIVLSNQGQTQDIEEAKAAGAVGYIIKAEAVPSDVVTKVEALAK